MRLSLKAPAAAEKDFFTNGGKREARHKHAAGEKCLSSKADCKGVSSGSYRSISCKSRYVLFKLLIKNLKFFLIFDLFLRKCFMLNVEVG